MECPGNIEEIGGAWSVLAYCPVTRITRRLAVLIFAVLALGVGCASPTLPLPPPAKPDVQGPDSQGMVTLSGNVQPGANVYAANLGTGDGRIQLGTGSDGAYSLTLPAQVNDELAVWYSVGTHQSGSVVFRVPAP